MNTYSNHSYREASCIHSRCVPSRSCSARISSPIPAITLNLPLKAVSACFRCAYDGSHFTTSFALTQTHCLGAVLMAPDGQYWQEPGMSSWANLEQYRELFSLPSDPRITTWRSMEDYLRTFPEKLSPEDLPWPMLLFQFGSMEITRRHPDKDVLDVIAGSGPELGDTRDIEMILKAL